MIARRGFIVGSLAAGLTAAATRSALAQVFQGGTAPLTNPLQVGLMGPFTGPDHLVGEQMADGVRQAFDQADVNAGILQRAVQFRTYDDLDEVAVAQQVAQFAADDGVAGAIGHLRADTTEFALRTYYQNRVPLVVPLVTADTITAKGYDVVFRLPTKDGDEGRLGAQDAATAWKATSAAVVSQAANYGPDVALGFIEAFKATKGASATQVLVDLDKPDFPAAAAAVMAAAPQVVYFAGVVERLGPLLGALREAGYKGPFAASQGFWSPVTAEKYAKEADGMIASTSMPPLALAPQVHFDLDAYQTRYGPITPVAAFCYAAAQVVAQAAATSGATSRSDLLPAIAHGNFNTMVGAFRFTAQGDPLDPNLYFYQLQQGKWIYRRQARNTGFIV